MGLPNIAIHHYILIGVTIGVLGVIGDLFESLVKRAGFAKDSGIFFPGAFLHQLLLFSLSLTFPLGHGGVLDRFDSFLFAVPAIYYYVLFVPLP